MYKIYTKNAGVPLGYVHKLLLVMKLTTFIMLLSFMQVTAASFGQSVTLKENGVSMTKIFYQIRKQTGYDVMLKDKNILSAKQMNANFNNAPLNEVMEKVVEGTGLTFEIGDKKIVIREKEKSIIDRVIEYFKNIDVSGKVVDAAGQPIGGATVKVKGSTLTTTTDGEGKFTLRNIPEDAVLVITSIGFKPREIKAAENLSNIRLDDAVGQLQEVTINKGYYSTKKELNTGSVSTVSAKTLSQQPVGDLLAALQGQVPGLVVEQQSGIPGTRFTVQLRGKNSIANQSEPLYIIDGVPHPSSTFSNGFTNPSLPQSPLNYINIANIESITVLKDADATAIYGSQGANGVILITTKRGSLAGTRVDASFMSGAGTVPNRIDLMNTQQYLEMRRESFMNDGRPVPDRNATPSAANYDLTVWDENAYTDWQDVIMGGTAKLTDAQVRVSGGSGKTQFTLGSNWRKETMVFPGNNYDQKLSMQFGINHTSNNEKFRMRLNGSYGVNKTELPPVNYMSFITLAPNTPSIYNADGSLNWANETWQNPLASTKITNRSKANNLTASGMASYELIPGLSAQISFGINDINTNANLITPISSYSPIYANVPAGRTHRLGKNNLTTWQLEPQVNYYKNIGKNRIEALAGTTFRSSEQESLYQLASTFPSDQLIENIQAASSITTNSFNYQQYKYEALFGRVGYTYNDKYVLNFTGRRDGSSRFGPGKRFGNFGALGAAWILSKENFMKKLSPVLNFAKLRASYGLTGNDQFQDYEYLSTYQSVNYTYLTSTGLRPVRHVNPEYHWETIKKLEFALEAGLFNDLLQFTGSYYRNRTGNQLVGNPLPYITGFNSVQANLPAVIQNSGIELELKTSVGKADRLNWQVSGNISFPRNKLVSYPGIEGSSYRTRYQVGKSLFGNYMAIYTGIDSQTGEYTFLDKNNDGNITIESDYEYIVTEGKFNGGINNTFQFKGVTLSFLFQFAKRTAENFVFASTPAVSLTNQPAAVLIRWQKPGDMDKLVQRYTTRSSTAVTRMLTSNERYKDASFVRLKNISLEYAVPSKYTKNLGLQNISIYGQGQNLFTWANSYIGLDPETTSQFATLPPVRMISAGIRITF